MSQAIQVHKPVHKPIPEQSASAESPCNKVCMLVGSTCKGCGRTTGEIMGYGGASEIERRRINAKAARRLATLSRKAGSLY